VLRRAREVGSRGGAVAVLAAALGSVATSSLAHDLPLTRTLIQVGDDGSYAVDMIADLDALALGAPPGADSGELATALQALPPEQLERRVDQLRVLFQRRVRVLFDGEAAPPERVEFPEHGSEASRNGAEPTLLGLTARLSGRIPEGAATLAFRASRAFPPVQLSVRGAGGEALYDGILEAGGESDPISLAAPERPGARAVLARYVRLGLWHIVPEGVDHVLFVLGLVLLSPRLAPLLWQVSAFTAAHTLTLGLSSLGVVALSPAVVEPLIALSIAYVAVENCVVRELKPWRPLLVFGFGLLHGLGFAGVLGEIGLPPGERLAALLGFNVGVEGGQLLVIAATLLAVGWTRDRSWYRTRVAVPISLSIAAVGLTWAVERAFPS